MNSKIRVSAFVRNKKLTPSSYYRVVQYLDGLDAQVQIRSIAPTNMYSYNIKLDKSRKITYAINSSAYYVIILLRCTFFLIMDNLFIPDYVIVSKYIVPKYMPKFIGFLLRRLVKKSRLYWDIDDYIFNKNGAFTEQDKILGTYSKRIIVTSDFLKSKLLFEWQSKVILLPTTDGDLQGFNESELLSNRIDSLKQEVRLVWVATKASIKYLNDKMEILERAAEILKIQFNKDLILTVVCNAAIDYSTKYLKIRNILWTREIAKIEIYQAHIGIMPLNYDEIALGKGGFKLIQYISTGLPVIASAAGYNNRVVDESCGILIEDKESNDAWVDAIINMTSSLDSWKSYSYGAYRRWNEKFSYEDNLKIWRRLVVSKVL